MRFCYDNKIDDYTLSANSATAGYPVSNINDFQLAKQHRSTGDSAEWWKLAGATTVINATYAYIAGHNISSGATVITCVGGDVDDIASYTASVTFTHNADIMVSFFPTIDRGDCESETPPMIFDETVPLLTNATFERDEEEHIGTYSYKVTKATAAGTISVVSLVDNNTITDMHGMVAGHIYTYSEWVKVPSASGIALAEVKLVIGEYYDAGWHLHTSTLPTAFDTWQKLSLTVTINTNTSGTALYVFYSTAPEDTEYFYVDDIELEGIVSVTHKYWWFKVTDSANSDGLIKIGRLGLGTYLDWTPGVAVNFPYEMLDSTTRWMSKTGQIYSNEGVTAKSYTFDIPFISDTQRQSLETMFDDVKGNEPILWVPNENYLTRIEPLYCIITSLSFTHLYNYNYSASIGLMEVR